MQKSYKKEYALFYRAEAVGPSLMQWLDNNIFTRHEEWQGFFHQGRREKSYCINPGEQIFVKCFLLDKRQKVAYYVRSVSRAWRAFRMSYFLFRKGIPTPEPLAYALIKKGPNKGRELLFTRWLEHTKPLGLFADTFFSDRTAASYLKEKRAFAVALGSFVRQIHVQGVYHGDFNINNILIRAGHKYELFLIDTADIRSLNWISQYRIFKNLDEVNRFFLDTRLVTRVDRLRFLKAYLGSQGSDRQVLRKYWFLIQNRTEKRLKIHQKEFKK
ncbi:lipopolysaccharide kinase InaA family protein [candidate division CSSED10-310 bacterium]|uniref:Lipopolysaccharide kinase InaA family protein n=1 Tax=candidate division CSSED10-310 bacterium TaxID=2855610 RepID=A0ABV6YV16_UNCC1